MEFGKRFWIIFVLVFLAGSISAKDLYVDKDSRGGACSDSYTRDNNNLSQPFCTIHKGESVTMPGDFVYIRNGSYQEQSNEDCYPGPVDCGTLYPRNSGTLGNPITFKGYPGDQMPRILGGVTIGSNFIYPVAFDGVDHIIIDGLDISGGPRGVIVNSADYITVRNCVIHDNTQYTGYNNNIAGVFATFVGLKTNLVVENNTIYHNWDTIGAVNNNGVLFYDCVDCIVRDNHIYDEYEGIYLKGDTNSPEAIRNISVYGNTVHDVSFGIEVGGAWSGKEDIEIFGNVVYNTDVGLGVSIQGDDPTDWDGFLKNINYYSNTVDCGGVGSGYQQRYGTDNNTNIYNNIFYDCYISENVWPYRESIAINLRNQVKTSTEFTENYNLLWNADGETFYYKWGDANPNWIWNQWRNYWQSTSPPEHSDNGLYDLFGQPVFADEANHNYYLQSNSPGVDNGTFIPGFHCALSDSNGGASLTGCRHWYGSAPDIGAFEYNPGGTPTCYDVNNDGKINIKDLALVIYNQGQLIVNRGHLDVDKNGAINFDDVQLVIGGMGGSC